MSRGYSRTSGFSAREPFSEKSVEPRFEQALNGLSKEQVSKIRDSIFFDAESARRAKFENYKGPANKNSFAWFRPEVESEVFEKSKVFADGFKDILGKIWDEAPKGDLTEVTSNVKVPTGLLGYNDRQTFIDRNLRFLSDGYKNVFSSPLSAALGTTFSTGRQYNFPKSEVYLDASDKMRGLTDRFNAMLREANGSIRDEAYRYLKSRLP